MTIHESRKMGGVQSLPLLESSSHLVVFKPAPLPPSLGTVILVQDETTATTPALAPAPASNGGSTNIAGACTASTEAESYDSREEYDYEGKYEGSFYMGNTKPSKNNSLYSPVACG
jgi:hypothetical protein